MELTEDKINHPSHYDVGRFECIDVMEDVYGVEEVMSFCLCNAFKYLYRCEHKDNKKEDLMKARWYIDRYLKLSEKVKEFPQ